MIISNIKKLLKLLLYLRDKSVEEFVQVVYDIFSWCESVLPYHQVR